MRRLALLVAVGATWLFLAALPALADGGPHVSTINNGSLGINADSCAGCHRAHTAQGPYLINAADEEALCLTCHGSGGVGSTVDVMTGVQYKVALPPGSDPQDPSDPAVLLGALRNGGFDQARIDAGNAVRIGYYRTATDTSGRPKVGVGAPENVTSSHLGMADNGLTMPGIAWGNGANGSGVGPVVDLSCASCHNPHGNGQYRILNKIPEATDADSIAPAFDDAWTVPIVGSVASNDRILTEVSHALLPGDTVIITGTAFNGTYTVASIGTDSTTTSPAYTGTGAPFFRVYASGTSGAILDITADSTALTGTVERSGGVVVTDSPADNPDVAESDVKNYTVIQTQGTQGTNSTYLLYADDVVDAGYGPTEGDYFHRNVPWYTNAEHAPITGVASNVFTTSVNHGLSTGNSVWINGITGLTNGWYTVLAAAPASTTFTLTGVTVADQSPANAYSSRLGGGTGAGFTLANDAPNGQPATVGAQNSFSEQITAWCASCHTRYFADRNPTDVAGDGINTGSAWGNARPGDSDYKYQHRTVPNRACVTCHVSHGSNAAMTGTFSKNVEYPNDTVPLVTENGNSRLLKIDNRGTCQGCHDPTNTITPGFVSGSVTLPAIP